ncbi:hypothetical protein PHLGIDRAFT_119555 [Phlebiopsis gigantea 11061_1 CR5-6]|uniref:DUF6534 domain-containing protein n=1 Tax=Phlebiopsis gigantea (strain 11061_1 CR5-6) TaxID=745531 RepID=A0A0C3RW54_PHLG1|nr:hypothetical protein PHLGIDRAFT_119555 [Phlebiopsis gigantea 11061_1 CR5-6]
MIARIPAVSELHFGWLWFAMLGSQTCVDFTLALSLCTSLWKSRTGFHGTDSLVNVLIMYAVNTCVLTASTSIASIVTFALVRDTYVFVLFAMILPGLMLNSLLAVLNSRQALRSIYGPQGISVHVSKFPSSAIPFASGAGEASTAGPSSSE